MTKPPPIDAQSVGVKHVPAMPASVLMRQQLVPAVGQTLGQLPSMDTLPLLLPPPSSPPLLLPPELPPLLLPPELPLPLLAEASGEFDGVEELLHAIALATAIPRAAIKAT
jgi:hypothetical protein